ncbi:MULTISPECIES: helix-turn-helix domain-containing protein [Nocardiopsis]|uniref:HTH cro/C1-type domain-containing protein n=1 Tax=Nocardiopsis sinuspersici TaxID=501010 RepID=A0A1V3BVP8_9ACTN|nr:MULTISPECIES: helix-turn-helix transcriptional regulator [Nocardiopsis]OOC52611.1 hypothetical protein NOSIN_01185 [Nocardiopsis sinuspersici]
MTEPDPTPTLRFDRKAFKRLRTERNLSREALARLIDTRPTSPLVADWEAGWSAPQLRNIGRLARALECDPADLLEWSTDEVTPRERREAAAERDAAEG